MKYLLTLLSFCVGACSGQIESATPNGGEALPGTANTGAANSVGAGGAASTAPAAGGVAGKTGTEVEMTPEHVTAMQNYRCNSWSFEVERVTNYVSLLVDRSESMNVAAAPFAISHWGKVCEAIDAALGRDVLQAFSPDTYLELRLFPVRGSADVDGAATCATTTPDVPFTYLDYGTSVLASKLNGVLATTVPNGRSPILDAYNATVQSFTMSPPPGAHSIVLLTDGFSSFDASCQEPCSLPSGCKHWWDATSQDSTYADPGAIIEAIDSAWRNHGIRTMVAQTGAGVTARAWMSDAAIRGHTSQPGCDPTAYNCHIDLSVHSLGQQLHQAWPHGHPSCVFAIPGTGADGMVTFNPAYLGLVRKTGDGRQFLLTLDTTTTPTCEQGFRFNASGQLELCLSSCEALIDSATPSTVEVLLGCGPEPRMPLN